MKLTRSKVQQLGYRKRHSEHGDFYSKRRRTRNGTSRCTIFLEPKGSGYGRRLRRYYNFTATAIESGGNMNFSEVGTVGELRSWEEFAFCL